MYSLGEPYALSLDQIMCTCSCSCCFSCVSSNADRTLSVFADENYVPEPRNHFGGGTWPTGKGTDGGLRRYPISFEVE